MAGIVHIGEGLTREETIATTRRFFERLPPALILAEQCVLVGALDALHTLQKHTGPQPAARQLMADCFLTLDLLTEVAAARKVHLIEMSLPPREETKH